MAVLGRGVKVWCCLSEINSEHLSQQPEARLASYKPVSESGKRSQSNPNNNQVSPSRNSPPPRSRPTSLIKSAHASFRFFVGAKINITQTPHYRTLGANIVVSLSPLVVELNSDDRQGIRCMPRQAWPTPPPSAKLGLSSPTSLPSEWRA